jgi:hypothetical protein
MMGTFQYIINDAMNADLTFEQPNCPECDSPLPCEAWRDGYLEWAIEEDKGIPIPCWPKAGVDIYFCPACKKTVKIVEQYDPPEE